MSVYELYPDHHEFDIKLDLKKALMSIPNSRSLSKDRKIRLRILYVLVNRFFYNRTLEAIGNDLGVSPERVRQAEARGLRYLKHPKHGLKG